MRSPAVVEADTRRETAPVEANVVVACFLAIVYQDRHFTTKDIKYLPCWSSRN